MSDLARLCERLAVSQLWLRCANGCRCGTKIRKIATYYKWGQNINTESRRQNSKDVNLNVSSPTTQSMGIEGGNYRIKLVVIFNPFVPFTR